MVGSELAWRSVAYDSYSSRALICLIDERACLDTVLGDGL